LGQEVPEPEGKPKELVVQSLSAAYGNIGALWDANLTVGEGEIVSIIGANGAGKSTLLKAVMGVVRPKGGRVAFGGRGLDGLKPHEIVSLGIAYVPEGRRLFPNMTVAENLRISTPRRCPDLEQRTREVFEIFPVLEQRRSQAAGTLSGGEQQMVAIGRGLMAKPRLMLMDEPSFGLSPIAYEKVLESIVKINQDGVGVLLAEQNSERALETSNRSYVLENGRVGNSGLSADLIDDPAVKVAYLGL
jgi:branched-chain amino acid transport system ATP-binding protein